MAAGLVFTLLLGLSFRLWDGADAICQVRANTPLDCPAGWAWHKGRCFVYVKNARRWIVAEKHCLSMDGNLASFRNAEEYNFIRQLVYDGALRHEQTWVGGHDSTQEGTWFWSDGSRFVLNSTWTPGEPSNLFRNEHCLELNYNGLNTTADENCQKKRPYVCVRPL